MSRQNIFPAMAFSESLADSSVKLEGQKVMFDKKVSLLPADIRREDPIKVKSVNGRAER